MVLCSFLLLPVFSLPLSCNPGDPPPRVIETKTYLKVEFPGMGTFQLAKQGKNLLGMQSLKVGNRTLFSMGKDPIPMPVIEVVTSCSIPPVRGPSGVMRSWVDQLRAREGNSKFWVSRGQCFTQLLDLAKAPYEGATIDGRTVTLKFRTSSGPVFWVFEGRTDRMGGSLYRGLGWSLEVSPSMEGALRVYFQEPLPLGQGDWFIAQNWGSFLEIPLSTGTRFHLDPDRTWGALQPFLFLGGKGGALLGWLEKPASMLMEINRDGPHLVRSLGIPFGPGPHRSTPVKYWEASDQPLLDRWARLNAWTDAYDGLAGFFRSETGIQDVDPLPTYLWGIPQADYYLKYLSWKKGKSKTPPTPWLKTFRIQSLDRIAKIGLRNIYLQSPWHSDLEHLKEDRWLPTRHDPKKIPILEDLGSGHAPWEQRVSQAIGGEGELKRFVDRAHSLGTKVFLWTNLAHLSISSSNLMQHPDWAMWTKEGVPQDEGWGDITGMNLFGGYYQDLLDGLRRVRRKAGVDGVWLDSYLTFGAAVDFAREEPRPQLVRCLDLAKDLQKEGIQDVHLEGVGLLGLSTGGFGYEATSYEGKPNPQEWKKYLGIRGREYGLYHYIADTFIEAESYYRALASKGVLSVFNLQQLDKLEKKTPGLVADLTRANREYLFVLPWMQRRHLIGKGELWQGVAWGHDKKKETVVFSFTPFPIQRPGSWMVLDLTEERIFKVNGKFTTKAWHTYLLGPSH